MQITSFFGLRKPEDTDVADNADLNYNMDKIDKEFDEGFHIGDLRMTLNVVAPTVDWMVCDGAEIDRTTYASLFVKIGTAFGVGDGSTTFNLPDFRGMFPVAQGGAYTRGDTGGANTVTLTAANMPAHDHELKFSAATGSNMGNIPRGTATNNGVSRGAISIEGSGTAHENRPPFLTYGVMLIRVQRT